MATLLLVLPAASRAAITIRRDTVIPVVFEDELSLRTNRAGDRFMARVEGDRDIPYGTRMEGRIAGIRAARGTDPAYMDLEFTHLLLSNGRRIEIRAYPVPLGDRYVQRDREGRFKTTENVKKRETMVLGGTAAGLILGYIFKRPFEGAVLGAIAGVVLAEEERKNGSNIVVERGKRMGALVDRDFTLDGSRPSNGDDRYRNDDWYRDANGNWNLGRDRNRNDRWNDDRSDSRAIRISYRDRALAFEPREEPFRIENQVMVPLYRTAEQLDLRVERSRDTVYYIENDENSLRFEEDSREYRLNGRRESMPQAPRVRDGVLFVPIEVFAKLTREKLSVNGNRINDSSL
ncbi:MAG TPA: stalk domain-containing protein [Fimbriimonas sp.]